MIKKILYVLGLVAVIYGFGHVYFTQKTPAIVTLALMKGKKRGLRVSMGDTHVGHYLFRPYVTVSHLALTPKSAKLPNFSLVASQPTRFMLNWWKGQNVTVTNPEKVVCEIMTPGLKTKAQLQNSRVTLSRVDHDPLVDRFFAERLKLEFLSTKSLYAYTAYNVRARRRSESGMTSRVHFSADKLFLSGNQNHDIDTIEGTFVLPYNEALNAFMHETITIPTLTVRWKASELAASARILLDKSGNRYIQANISIESFSKALDCLHDHPNISQGTLNAWAAAVKILAITIPGKTLSFTVTSNGIYLLGKLLFSFTPGHGKSPFSELKGAL
ncbi:MAG: hypothetical protein H6849_04550 [Alphaproteobacteria bacterium]|nr:MAG: hypothetical protein H6849_04550 [Alphaproteobacteria bacterium]